MFTNYLKVAFRNLRKHKSFSLINIMGLALGLTSGLLIMLWIQHEKSVDGFHANGQLLYQVYERNYHDGGTGAGYSTQGLLAVELKRVIPEVQYASGFEYTAPPGTLNTMEANNKVGKMQGFFAGADFFSMFSYPLLEGSAGSALNAPNAIAVSRNMAAYYFGNPESAIGKVIRFENKEDLLVTAVFENLPANSSQQFDFLRSWTDFVQQNAWVNNWGNTSPATFVQLRPDADPAKVEATIKDFIYRYQAKDPGFVIELALQPYTERYLNDSFNNGYIDGGRIEYIRILTWVAVFILMIACINFMNLATARSINRAKEIGIRKVAGAYRLTLIKQFKGEAMLLTAFSVIIALLLAAILLPAFNDLTGKQLKLPAGRPTFWLAVTGLLFLTGFTAGIYPAVFLSSLKPVQVLKGSLKFNWKSAYFRKGLVVFQFSLSIILIIGMIVIYRQMNFIQSKNIGYNRENLIYLPIEGELVKKYDVFRQEAGQSDAILSVSKMRNTPTVIEHHTTGINWPGKDPNLSVSFADAVVGYDFVKTLKLTLKEGRDFSRDFGTDSASYILNETAVQKMELENPIGQTVYWGNRPGKIIGVLKDFHFNSLHQAIDPLIIRHDENWSWGTILVRTKAGKTKEALAKLEKVCKTLNPKFPFTYQFSDQEYAKLYGSEQVISKLAGIFAFMAIFISCLGLFGLAAFTAGQRTKEIGVRKVLGASVPNVVTLLATHFLKPVGLALLIAIPLAAYLMQLWLQGFVYKTDMEWWIFGLAALVTVGIALITVGFQSIKAAIANPVKSLRTE